MPAFLVCNERTAAAVLSQSTAVIAILSPEINEVAELPVSLWEQNHPDRYLRVAYHHCGWSCQLTPPDLKFCDCLRFVETCLQRFGYDLNFALYSHSNSVSAYTLALVLYTYWLQDPQRAIALVEEQSPLKDWEEVDRFLLHHFFQQQPLQKFSRQLWSYCQLRQAQRRSFLREQNRSRQQDSRRTQSTPQVQSEDLDWLDLE
uniref:Uncharacterized protein n=1 Tax=Cyanothece sp. (strain PCC 7425 / ATCC 29141) TaxID=395961 RepID=B8HZL6_CYAP4